MALFMQIITVLAVLLIAIVAPKCNSISKTAAQNLFAVTRPGIFLPVTLFSSTMKLDRKAPVSRVVSEFEIRTILKEKPKFHRAEMTLTVMSFIVKNEHLSQAISNSIIECLATETFTKSSDWGAYKADQFAASMIQVEYLAFVNTQNAPHFRTAVASYVLQRQLAWCVRSKVSSFAPNADIIYGRNVIEVLPDGIRHFWSAPNAWELALIVGHVLMCAALFFIAVWSGKIEFSLFPKGKKVFFDTVVISILSLKKCCIRN